MPSSDLQDRYQSDERLRAYAIGGIVRVLCCIRLLVLVLAVAEVLLRQDGGILAFVALAAAPFSFVPVLNWNTRGPVYFRNGVLLSGDIVVTVLVLVALAGAPLVAAYGAATVALWGATTNMRVAVLMALPVAALVVPWTALDEGWRTVTGSVVSVAAVAAMAWAGKTLGESVRRHQEVGAELARERAEHAAMEERLRIARDLHDTVAGDLAGMQLMTQGLRGRVESGESAEACTALVRALDEAVGVAHRHTRVALDELRSDQGLDTDLERMADRWEARTGTTPSVSIAGPVASLSRRVAGDARAVVGELLENVRKHAEATAVSVEVVVAGDGRSVEVTVEDDGRGLPQDSTPDGHYGVRGIRERAEVCGGSAVWERPSIGGTRARVTLCDPSLPTVGRSVAIAIEEQVAS